MAKPKGPSNPKTGNKLPVDSSLEITEKKISSLDLQLEQLKLDKEYRTEKINQAEQELDNSSEQEAQSEDGLAWLAKRIIRDREINNKRKEAEKEKKPKTIILGPKIGIKRYISELNKGVCTVEFYKRTSRPRGEFRRMRCTLEGKDVIPENPIKPGIITVWDLDANNWRSFYHTSILRLIRNEETDTQ